MIEALPIATRTAISCLRRVTCANDRFADSVHAISSRQNAAPRAATTWVADSGAMTSCSVERPRRASSSFCFGYELRELSRYDVHVRARLF